MLPLMTMKNNFHFSTPVKTVGAPQLVTTYYIKCIKTNKHPLPWKASSVFVLVLVSQATRGLDVEMSVQLVDEHEVDVELLAVELQPQISKPLHLEQGSFQGLHS